MSRRKSVGTRSAKPGFDRLEGRALLTGSSAIGFKAAFGLGSFGQYSAIHSNAVATDASGDTFLTGSFKIGAGFDPNQPGTTSTTSNTEDTFVAKYSPTGTLVWLDRFVGHATTSGSTTTYATSQGSAIVVDASGNVFVAGGFSGTVDFGSGSSLTTLSSPGGTEVYAAKLNASGGVVWVQSSTGSVGDDDEAYALALDGSGGVVIAGSYAETVSFGTTTLTSAGASEAFVVHLNGAGQYQWAISTKGTAGSNAQANGVAVDGSGNVVLAGFFSGSVNFNPGSGSTVLTGAGSDDAAVWKLNASGQLLWARSYGSPDYDTATSVGFDTLGNVYATGTFSGTVEFGVGPNGDNLTAGTVFNAFAIKLDASGNEVWAKGFVGPNGYSKGQGIAVDVAGNVQLAGVFTSTVDFNPGSALFNLTSTASASAFVVGLDTFGNFVYALMAGQSGFNAALGIAVNAIGAVEVTGSFSGSISFGSVNVGAVGVSSVFAAGLLVPIQPPAPSSPQLEAGSNTGVNNTTSINNPIFDVTSANPGDTLELLRDGVIVNQRVGPGAIQDPGPSPDGTHLYTAIQLTPTGIASPVSPTTTVTILTKSPAAPSVLQLLAADDSGTLSDGITNVVTPRLTGSGPASITIQLLNAANLVIGTTTSTLGGLFTVQPGSPLANGVYALKARAVDAANNLGPAGAVFNLTILAQNLAAPGSPKLVAADDTGLLGDGITSNRSPRVTSTATANTTVQILTSTNTVLATTNVPASGIYTVALSGPLIQGSYQLHAVATDAAGNVSPPGNASNLTIQYATPATPGTPSLVAADDSGVVGDGITNIRQPRLNVADAVSGLTLELINAANAVVGTSSTPLMGIYTIQVSTSLADGTYSLRAVAVDVAGNTSAASPAFSLVIQANPLPAPAPPALLVSDDTGYLGDGLTSVTRPRLTGTAAPGGRVDWLSSSGLVVASTTASTANGSYQLQAAASFANGYQTVQIRATDIAGNVSPVGQAFNLTIRAAVGDDFGNSISDIGTFSPSLNRFNILQPSNGALYRQTQGVSGDVPIQGDFFGDGHSDIATYHPANATFTITEAGSTNTLTDQWGVSGDIPVTANYDGLGKADIAVFRPSNQTFYIRFNGSLYAKQWGAPGDFPVPGDYFGNGHADIAVFRPSTASFYVLDPITGASVGYQWGAAGDIAMPADYEGLGHADIAIFRPSNDTYYVRLTSGGAAVKSFGATGDTPVLGDYFGLGRASVAVYRPSTSTFYAFDLITNSSRTQQWGSANSDKPILAPLSSWFNSGGGMNNFVIMAGSTLPVLIVPDPAQLLVLNPPPRKKR